jgi:MFS family permease
MRRLGPANYVRLWAASTVSNLGDGVSLVALPLLAATLTRDPLLVALLSMSGQLPWLLVSLHAGAIADRVDRRRLMARVDLIRMGLAATVGVAALGGWVSIPLLCALAFLLGSGETLYANATQPLIPAVAGDLPLESANARLYAGEVVTNGFVGQPVGGLLFAAAAGLPFLFDAASFAVSAALLLSIRGVFRPERAEHRPSLTRDVGEGLRWLRGNRLVRGLAGLLGVLNFTYGLATAVLVLFALEELGLSDKTYGLLLVALPVGGLIGSAVAARVSAGLGPGTSLAGLVILAAGADLGLFLSSDPYSAGAMLVLGGFIVTVWNVITISLRQEIIPDRLLGRVTGAYRLVGAGAAPLGALAGGLLASRFGLRAPFIVAAAGNLLCLPPIVKIASDRAIAAARSAARGTSSPSPPAADRPDPAGI